MTFEELLAQVTVLLQREKRISYRGLKRRFALDDEYLEDLKEELIGAKRLAADEDGRFLVWMGDHETAAAPARMFPPLPPAPSTAEPHTPDAERRQLTVEFIDLVGSTALSEQLDPEELRQVVRAYQQSSAAVIARYDGHIAQYLGDGILVYFGYPTAHDDDAARAVRAGLEIIEALHQLNPQFVTPLRVRIGIHTGPVVIGEIGGGAKREQLAVGETPNIAARVQSQAEPDTVVMSAATYRLVQGLFECQELGMPTLKGITTLLALYRIVRESEARSRFDVAVSKGLTPLVGREEELGLLRRRWEQAQEGAGQVVLLSGEPGIGKSRLVQTLKEQVVAQGSARIEFRCSPYHQNSAFYPIIEHLQRLLQFAPHDAPEAKLAKLQQGLAQYHFPQADTLPLLASLLSLPHLEGVPPLTLSPQKQKQKTQEALVAWVVEEAERTPVYCAWEDLHWADPSTLEVLTLLLDQAPTTRLLTLLTFRPDFTPPWGLRSYLTPLTLNRLERQQVEAMVEQVTGGKALPVEVLQQIVAKTDGVPLFVEELTKMVLESRLYVGATYASPLSLGIPATLQDTLMARLDRLAPVRELAQIGAVLGREFGYELLHAVSSFDAGLLQQGLQQLVAAELIYQRGLPPQATYTFKHALVQDTAYDSLLKSRRQELHGKIARVLEEDFPTTTATEPELLAHHLTAARQAAAAIPFWQKAGKLAIKRLALKEAIAHLNQGMEILGTLSNSPERDETELDLRTALGTAWMALKGWSAPELWTSLHPALGLAKSLGRREALLPIYYGLTANLLTQGRLAESLVWMNDMLGTAEASGDLDLLTVAHREACTTHFWRGELLQSRMHGDRVMALYDEAQHRHIADLMNIDPLTSVGMHVSLGAWMLGYPDRAKQMSEANIAHARRRGHPFDLGFALTTGGLLWDSRCEPAHILAWVEEAERLGRAHSLPVISEVLAQVLKGVAWLRAGRLAEGIPQLRGAMERWNAHGAELSMPYLRAVLAEGLAVSGEIKDGLRLIEESLAQIARPGWEERCHLAEILRLKGGMLALQGDLKGAQQHYLASLDVAREQQAKSWELRTSTSLARLWQQQGKHYEAHNMLSKIYNWFTEGFDTKDLQEAKALLEELS